jgi:hypothetical protein
MYRKESVRDGILGVQSTPNGEWRPYTAEQLTERLLKTEKKVNELNNKIDELTIEINDLIDERS